MGRRKKAKKDPLSHLRASAQIILDTGKIKSGNNCFELNSLERNNKSGEYKCELIRSNGTRKIFYSHVKEAYNKLDAVTLTLEHLEMMGHEGLSSEEED